jgi:hypothetical protein
MTRSILPLLLLLSACEGAQQPADKVVGNEANAVTADQAPAAAPSLVGGWTVTQINGAAPVQVWPMTVAVTADRFTLTSECRQMAWGLKQDRNVVRLTPQAGRDCARVRSPAELTIEKPLNLANIAMFSNEGRQVELSGPGGRVTLTRR